MLWHVSAHSHQTLTDQKQLLPVPHASLKLTASKFRPPAFNPQNTAAIPSDIYAIANSATQKKKKRSE